MKKLNLTEVRVIARQIAMTIFEKQQDEYEKATKNPTLKKDLIALAKTHPIVALHPTLSSTEQTILKQCVNGSRDFENSLKGNITIPRIERVNNLCYYNIYTNGCKDDMQDKLNVILVKHKVPTELTDLVERYYNRNSKPVINEKSDSFKEIVDKIIIEQIDCKDLQSLIKKITRYFS